MMARRAGNGNVSARPNEIHGLDHSGATEVLAENGEVALTDKAGYSGTASTDIPRDHCVIKQLQSFPTLE